MTFFLDMKRPIKATYRDSNSIVTTYTRNPLEQDSIKRLKKTGFRSISIVLVRDLWVDLSKVYLRGAKLVSATTLLSSTTPLPCTCSSPLVIL